MSSLFVKIDLGQSSVTTNSANFTGSQSTLSLGKFVNRYDTTNAIEIQRPTNNRFSVKIMDNLTNALTTEVFDYVIQIFLEPI